MHCIWVSTKYNNNNTSGGIAVIIRCRRPITSVFLKLRKENENNKIKKHAKTTYDMYIGKLEDNEEYTPEKYEYDEQNAN